VNSTQDSVDIARDVVVKHMQAAAIGPSSSTTSTAASPTKSEKSTGFADSQVFSPILLTLAGALVYYLSLSN
jgi:hypothetical protein